MEGDGPIAQPTGVARVLAQAGVEAADAVLIDDSLTGCNEGLRIPGLRVVAVMSPLILGRMKKEQYQVRDGGREG